MRNDRRCLTISVASGLVVLIGLGLRAGQADDPQHTTAKDVIALWKPMVDGTEDFQQFVASPDESPGVAACTFRVVGPSFESLWNHYADRCGIADRYDAKRFLVSGKTGPKGSYVISDRPNPDAKGGRGLSVFLLRTDHHTVTATIQPDPDGKSVCGSIAAVIP